MKEFSDDCRGVLQACLWLGEETAEEWNAVSAIMARDRTLLVIASAIAAAVVSVPRVGHPPGALHVATEAHDRMIGAMADLVNIAIVIGYMVGKEKALPEISIGDARKSFGGKVEEGELKKRAREIARELFGMEEEE